MRSYAASLLTLRTEAFSSASGAGAGLTEDVDLLAPITHPPKDQEDALTRDMLQQIMATQARMLEELQNAMRKSELPSYSHGLRFLLAVNR